MSMSLTSRRRSALRTAPPTKRALPPSVESASITAPVSAARIQSSRKGSSRPLIGAQCVSWMNSVAQAHNYRRGRTPDVMLFVSERIKHSCAALPFTGFTFAVGLIEKKGQRHLEYLRHFLRIGTKRKTFFKQADDREDRKAGSRLIRIKKSGNIDQFGIDSGFFARFPQGRNNERSILLMQAAARKTHLPRVTRQVLSPPGKEHCRICSPHDRNKHGSRHEFARRGGLEVGIEIVIAPAGSERQDCRLREQPRTKRACTVLHDERHDLARQALGISSHARPFALKVGSPHGVVQFPDRGANIAQLHARGRNAT